MNRDKLFADFFPEGSDNASLFDNEYSQLRDLWNSAPEEYREETLKLLISDMNGDFVEPLPENLYYGVSNVQQQYRYRLASDFAVDLPPYFRRVLMLADDLEMMELLFFGTLASLSVAMPGVRGSLMGERILPNLYFFISGFAASGKGKVNLCRRLLHILESHFEFPFVIPADTTATIFNRALFENGGRGIIFESEADTLTDALAKPNGHFSSALRKAFHNETISYLRSTNLEMVKIPEPMLSCLLTGTPGQVAGLFRDKSAENGLFSRFLFYRLSGGKESFVYNNEEHGNVTGDMRNGYLDMLGDQLSQFFYRLRDKALLNVKAQMGLRPDEYPTDPNKSDLMNYRTDFYPETITFRLSDTQGQRLIDTFHDETLHYKELFSKAYQSDFAANSAEGIMRRLGNICYRMMMVLSTSRLIGLGEDVPIPDEVVCDPRDFDTIMSMVPTLMFHNALHFDELMVATSQVPPLAEEASDTGDRLNPVERIFFQCLPDTFITQEALQVADKLSVTDRSVRRYLAHLCELGMITKLSRGSYEKSGRGYVDEQLAK